jgi:hypothetical protein
LDFSAVSMCTFVLVKQANGVPCIFRRLGRASPEPRSAARMPRHAPLLHMHVYVRVCVCVCVRIHIYIRYISRKVGFSYL